MIEIGKTPVNIQYFTKFCELDYMLLPYSKMDSDNRDDICLDEEQLFEIIDDYAEDDFDIIYNEKIKQIKNRIGY